MDVNRGTADGVYSTNLETVGEPNEADDFVLAASSTSCDPALSTFITYIPG